MVSDQALCRTQGSTAKEAIQQYSSQRDVNENTGSLDVSDNVSPVVRTVAISSPHRLVPSRLSERDG
jgi:hypothetical protein